VKATKNQNYLYRMVALFAAAKLAPILPLDMVKSELVEELVLPLVEDTTANVKLNVGVSLEVILPLLKDDPDFVAAKIEPAVAKLTEDKDMDVKFYASLLKNSS
jgi:hypothetical protein